MSGITRLLGFALTFTIFSALQAPAQPVFKQEFSLKGMHFVVEATPGVIAGKKSWSVNRLKITPSGLKNKKSNQPIIHQIDGSVTGAAVADLDNDGYPEIYVWANSAGSGSYGSVIAYAVDRGTNMLAIHIPPIAEDKKNGKGYMGHDEFAIVAKTFVQRFPIYRPGDSNAQPTGGIRQISYQLRRGKAGWTLVVDQVTTPCDPNGTAHQMIGCLDDSNRAMKERLIKRYPVYLDSFDQACSKDNPGGGSGGHEDRAICLETKLKQESARIGAAEKK